MLGYFNRDELELMGFKSLVVIFEKHSIVGANSVILPGVEVGEGAAVGALSLVTKDVPAFEIHAGVPARKISERKRNLNKLEEQLMGVVK